MAKTLTEKSQLAYLGIVDSDVAGISTNKIIDGNKLVKQASIVDSSTALRLAATGDTKLLICSNDEELGLATISIWTGSDLFTVAAIKR